MANRFPLIVDSSAQQIKELAASDNIDLTSSGIVNATSIASTSFSGTNINLSGVATASSFVGNLTGTATGLSGTPNVTVGIATASSFVGNLTGNATGLSGTPNIIVGIATVNTELDVGVGGTVITALSSTGGVGLGTATPVSKFDLFGSSTQNIVSVASSNVDCSLGNYFIDTVNGNKTYTVSGIVTNRVYSFSLEVTHTTGTITWFSGVEWPGGTAPTLTTGKTHLFMFVTDDGGSRWRGSSLINYTN